MTRVWFHAMGPTLGYLKQNRIGHPTQLFFFDLNGRLLRQVELPDAISEVAQHAATWYIGCRDGRVYAHTTDGKRMWRWKWPHGPQAPTIHGQAIGAPTLPSLSVAASGLGVAVGERRLYDRYRDQWLPEGVRWMAASEKYLDVQLDMDGYDRDVYMEMPLVNPAYSSQYSLSDSHPRRSYVAKFLTKEVNKLVNLCVLKHHQAAGVTLALKNLSHGCVNNVNRSHVSNTANVTGSFIPAVVDRPVFRQKVVLNILDGIRAAWHGGPGGKTGKYLWTHHTLYFATDPVALDKTGWKAIDAKRAEVGRPPIALLKPDADSTRLNCQVEHIELAGNIGLGVFDDSKIDLRQIRLT
jgi:hypothetical protein